MAQYTKNPPLIETDVLHDPLAQFARWLDDAKAIGMIEPTAMTLATVGIDGRPSARVVLMRGMHDGALRFFTNYESRKGGELAANPFAAATFWWDQLERSVRFEGRITRLDAQASTEYFHSRHRGSQVGAWTSAQSQVVDSRATLDARLAVNERRFGADEIPLPPFWGGYVLTPDRIEFWQGRDNRLHDRLRFARADTGWLIERLEP